MSHGRGHATILIASALFGAILTLTSCANPSDSAAGGQRRAARSADAIVSMPAPSSSNASAPLTAAPPSPSGTVTIESDIGETFSASSSVTPGLSAQAAWDLFTKQGAGAPLPANMTPSTGYLSVPLSVGGSSYSIKNEAVWAFVYPTQCVTTLPSSSADQWDCDHWVFLSASTGSFVFASYQKLSN